MTKPVVFISHSSKDKEFAVRLASELRARGLDIWIDHEQIKFGESIPAAIESGLKKSSYVIVVISPAFLTSKWCRAEYEPLIKREIESGGIWVVPVLIEDCEVPLMLAPKRHVDLRGVAEMSENLDDLSRQFFECFNQNHGDDFESPPVPLAEPDDSKTETPEERLIASLKKRLEKDFFISGESGRTRIPHESHLYHGSVREALKHKPYYYLTYWGWYVMPKLLPELVDDRSPLTATALKARFDGKRWIEVDIESYEFGPLPLKGVRTVRHTAKAAEILLLNNDFEIPSQAAWDLINDASILMSKDKGWKEFNIRGSDTSLWSSVFVFRFLSVLRNRNRQPDVPGDSEQFVEKSNSLIEKTEEFFESHWRRNKWKLKFLPFEVNAPLVLIEYVPFAHNDSLVESVYQALLKLFTPAGRLTNSSLGADYGLSEYVLSVRLAYALHLTHSLKGLSDGRVKRLIEWLVGNYSDEYVFDTCDIAFLNELVTFKMAGATGSHLNMR